ncbi:uncharacterized protein C2845_PM06G31440 [Panicum miliaceum]|uniref:Uncharacterized protein n=1 Tax=Panicum miliaceum TaxID=4540 RepID=A0A3L6RAL9_PANMI|nr:uncharacterized protein C2845_PM06G31440 [Panicum miliaceum]
MAAEWDSGSEAGPTGDCPSAAASPVKGNAALPEESDAGASASGSSEAKVDDGNIQEAESSLREGLSLNYERLLNSVKVSLMLLKASSSVAYLVSWLNKNCRRLSVNLLNFSQNFGSKLGPIKKHWLLTAVLF